MYKLGQETKLFSSADNLATVSGKSCSLVA